MEHASSFGIELVSCMHGGSSFTVAAIDQKGSRLFLVTNGSGQGYWCVARKMETEGDVNQIREEGHAVPMWRWPLAKMSGEKNTSIVLNDDCFDSLYVTSSL